MRSHKIEFQLKRSYIPLGGIVGLTLILVPLLYHVTDTQLRFYIWLLLSLATLIWLYKYLRFQTQNLVINTVDITIQIENKTYRIHKIMFLSWWFSLLIIRIPRKYIPIFIDSTNINNYKTLRILGTFI